MKEFVLGQGPGHKFEMAIGRNDGDSTHVEWLSSGDNFKSVMLLAEGKAELVVKPDIYLHRLGLTAIIPPTMGEKTIADSRDIFTGYLDSDFKNWGLDVKGEVKPGTQVEVLELAKNGTFEQFFNSLGVALDRLVLTDEQIIWVVKNRPDLLVLDGSANFFLKKRGDEFFVANVYRDEGRLEVSARRLSDGSVWYAGYRRRIVVPQL